MDESGFQGEYASHQNKGCIYHIWTFIVVMFILWAICWFAGNLG